MDSILKSNIKLVYDKWLIIDGQKQLLPNGVHPLIYKLIKEKVYELNDYRKATGEVEKLIKGQLFNFDHSNFYFYTSKTMDFIDISDVNENSDIIYIYPLELKGSGPNRKMSFYFNENIEYYFHETIDKKTFQLFKSGRVKILLNLAHDPMYYTNFSDVANYFNDLGINPLNVIFVTGNDCRAEYYSKPEVNKLTISPAPLLLTHQVSLHINEFPYMTDLGYVSELVTENDINSNNYRSCKFLCMNRTMKPHRYVLAYHALKNNLLKENYYSFLNDFSITEEGIESALSRFFPKALDLSEYSKLIKNIMPYHLDTHGYNEEKRSQMRWTNNKKEYYLNSYINIVTETSFEDLKKPFISEKLWKPVINLQPLIVVGNYHTLRTIKDLGFKSFSPFINESYDEIFDPIDRMQLILNEINKLNSLPINEIHDWYHSIMDILIFNKKHLLSLESLNPYQPVFEDINNLYKGK